MRERLTFFRQLINWTTLSFKKIALWPLIDFSGHYGSLEVIWRSFGYLKLKPKNRKPKTLCKDIAITCPILHAPKWDLLRKLCFQVTMGHLRSFRGHLVNRNSNLISAIDSAYKNKPMKSHITCPKVKFGKEVMFSGHLEVIWRSFGESELISDRRNWLNIQKETYEKSYYMPKSEIW